MPKLFLASCCTVLREIATIQISQTRSPLNQTHKSTRLKWVRKNKKIHLLNVTFTNKYQSTLDGPDEWAKCGIFPHHCPQVRVRHQQDRRGVMYLPTIIDDGSTRLFRVENGVMVDSQGYYAFLNKHFLP